MITFDQKRSIIKFIRTMGEVTVWGQAENLRDELDSSDIDLFLSECADILNKHILPDELPGEVKKDEVVPY